MFVQKSASQRVAIKGKNTSASAIHSVSKVGSLLPNFVIRGNDFG